MRTRTGLLGMSAIAMLVVGCAHTTTTPRITFIPDEFTPEVVQASRAEAATKAATPQQNTVYRAVVTRGSTSAAAGAAMVAEGSAESRQSRGTAYQTKSFRNGKKGTPAQLNVPMLIKMGGFAKLYGAADDTESGSTGLSADKRQRKQASGEGLTREARVQKMLQPKKKKPMLNVGMLIKTGFFAKIAEGMSDSGKKRGNPALLNISMLIKMGGFARGMEKETPSAPSARGISRVHRSNALSWRKHRAASQTREFKARQRINHSLFHRRSHLGGRCFGPNCRD